jgi:uncharacterized protein YdeI (YjbR/CyaY-like superfamily)
VLGVVDFDDVGAHVAAIKPNDDPFPLKQFYATLNKANLYSIAYRLQTAKRSETKIKRIKLIVDMLARGEKFH